MLKGRIRIIDGLREKRTGPVILLSSLANTVSLSEHLWLTSFVNTDTRVIMNGVAGSVNTVADFISDLKRSGQFKSVEIRQASQQDAVKDFPTFVFSINAERAPLNPASDSGTQGTQ